MTPIRVNQDIQLSDGYHEYEIDTDRSLELTFSASGNVQVFVRIIHCGPLRIRTFNARDSKVSYLFWNDMKEPLNCDETHEVMGDAEVTVAYGECNEAASKRKTYMTLRENGAHGKVSSASLVRADKNYSMEVVNFAPHTLGNIENYAVVLKGGKLMIDAIGKIVKGAKASESHQTSRALAFEEGQNAEILPELLIDENDVQASHAMSMGRVDDDQLYYLMSRGLTMQQCTSLISTGYLMPIADVIDQEELRNTLRKELEGKISSLC